ncbi:tRNA splicing 2' phosphotransferase 1 [Coccidioides immitis RMSCC 2394]|uniref:2'-phosphotransferase n=1 Tax=Coccidioides immitis RMSCC 2394 TaxID=404692 RepID=A0A0J6YMQ2_COCIT|nr:tRNA splicing 2' phosphotransferase 1 [Coccidioides immitis RMSCC 2394]
MARTAGRGERKEPSRAVAVSKALSYVLRHAAEREGVKIDSQGYANVGELLLWRKLKSLKVTFPDIIEAVSSSDKQRFGLLYVPSTSSSHSHDSLTQDAALQSGEGERVPKTRGLTKDATAQALAASADDTDPSHYLIRARQGHSIKSIEASSLLKMLSLEDDNLPATVVHGTYHTAWPKILETGGLKCMGRNQMHFATGPALSEVLPNGDGGDVIIPSKLKGRSAGGGGGGDGSVISGMRSDSQILIYIDLKKALAAGCPFWISENGVILSEGLETGDSHGKVVGTEFFDVAVELRRGLGVLWEKGSLVQRTPDWMLQAKGPPGKGDKRHRGPKAAQKRALPRVHVGNDADGADVADQP